jgi:hypothetical protein
MQLGRVEDVTFLQLTFKRFMCVVIKDSNTLR